METRNPEPTGAFSIELAEEPANLTCDHCGRQMVSVCGFISRDGDAYSCYFALLQTGHEDVSAQLTISVGNWWDDDALDERHWVLIAVSSSETQLNMRFDEPEKSRHFNFKPLGMPLSRAEALASPLKDRFFEVADYIVDRDPTVRSYLYGHGWNVSRNSPA